MYPFTVKFVLCLILMEPFKTPARWMPKVGCLLDGARNMVPVGKVYGKLELFEMQAYLGNSVKKSFIQVREKWISSLSHPCLDEYCCIVHWHEFLAPVVSLHVEALSYCIVSKTFAIGFQKTFDN